MAAKKTTRAAARKTAAPRKAAKTTRGARKTAPRSSRAAPDYEDGDISTGAPGREGSTLVIVESPAKAKTIGKYLGRGYRVQATVGHIMDLPEKKLGIDVDNGFEPDLVPIPGKEKRIAELKSAAKVSKEVLIATDPDREGEAIAYHVAEQIRPKGTGKKKAAAGGPTIKRVLFHEITRDAVRSAINNAGEIDELKV